MELRCGAGLKEAVMVGVAAQPMNAIMQFS